MMKRLFDVLVASFALVLLSPVLLVLAMLIKAADGGAVLYLGHRVGLGSRPFRMVKFRTMVEHADVLGGPSTPAGDPRVTAIGRWLRKYKLDELPQLINVCRGDMSLVGPRPEVQQYVDLYTEEEQAILTVRPGLTDWASLWNIDEGTLLEGSLDPEKTYMETIRPVKIHLQLEYVRRHSFRTDLQILLQTLVALAGGKRSRPVTLVTGKGNCVEGTVRSDSSMTVRQSLLRMMLLIRAVEERIGELVSAGEIKTPCHLSIGQEAIAAGVCAALGRQDTVWGSHRSHGHYLAKGGDLQAMMAEIFGKVTGCSKGRGGSMHLVAPAYGLYGTVPLVGATIPLAVGAGLASKLRHEPHVAVAFFGDGATEEGHFHESLNLAALYRLPVLFVCENNFYSTHMALSERRPNDNIVQVAEPSGMPAVRLDGNDVLAVFDGVVKAVARARAGEGPSFLECRTYRWRGHVGPGWDISVGENRRRELDEWMPKDPIPRLKRRLLDEGISAQELDALDPVIQGEIEAAVAFARASPLPDESDLFRHVYGPRR